MYIIINSFLFSMPSKVLFMRYLFTNIGRSMFIKVINNKLILDAAPPPIVLFELSATLQSRPMLDILLGLLIYTTVLDLHLHPERRHELADFSQERCLSSWMSRTNPSKAEMV